MTSVLSLFPLRRLLTLAAVALRVAGGIAGDRLLGRPDERDARCARRVRQAFEALGPTFVKLGQLLSTSTSPLPKAWIDELAGCRDHVTAVPWSTVEGLLDSQLGERRGALVAIDPEPLAAGSMAQVHAGRLAGGTRVVVKVQRPGLDRVLAQDMRLLKLAARLAVRVSRACAAANVTALVEDFAAGLSEQLSFVNEAANAEKMRAALAGLPVRVPRVYHHLSSERVLVMEHLEGSAADDLAGIGAAGADRCALARTVVATLLVPAITQGCFHADMHAGNMLVLTDGQLGLVDFGVVGSLEPEVRTATLELLSAMAEQRYEDALLAMVGLVPSTELDMAALVPQVQCLASTFFDKPIGELDALGALTAVLSLAAGNGFTLPQALVALFKQVVYISGLCQVLDPTFDILADLAPVLDAARRQVPVAA